MALCTSAGAAPRAVPPGGCARSLLLLQITLSSVSGHTNFWAAHPTLRSRWVDKLGPSHIRELWLTPYAIAGDGSEHVGQYVCTLAELVENNPSLRCSLS